MDRLMFSQSDAQSSIRYCYSHNKIVNVKSIPCHLLAINQPNRSIHTLTIDIHLALLTGNK